MTQREIRETRFCVGVQHSLRESNNDGLSTSSPQPRHSKNCMYEGMEFNDVVCLGQ